MLLFLDSANIEEIKQAHDLGVISGVTTNPSLIAQEGRNFEQVVREISSLVDGPISAEVISLNSSEMVKEGQTLAAIHPNIVVKIPMTAEGLKATKVLAKESIKVNMTLVFSANQALLASRAGAAFVSPFVGRLDDIDHNGMALVEEIVSLYGNYQLETKVIAASIRHPLHVSQAALLGADIATIPFKVLMQMVKHPLTDMGIERFLADWEKVKNK
ncbi:fructose-6-phosphate aldolase [Dehalobacterium formicoaceticum]|uniref:Probable transaldolase n=1 Tax=Dehalobacterium formicoaceticum TaxID=51515 RepID=A0ABT1Y3J4_9FIRM|nr:fructose-6-phosphate aldolase [Dehalobacterium formicoaceticum]MCR6545450.1 fructose-6-phosphate aldolase [Dehalobacterium formicoaceticum]